MATTFYLLVCTLIWTIFGVSLLLLTSPVAHSAEVRDNKGLHARQGRGLQDITHDQRWQYGDKSQKGLLQDNSDKSHITTKLGKGVRMIKKHKKEKKVSSVKLYRWGKWGPTSGCSKSCGVGVKYRKRNCYKTSDDVTSRTSSHLCRGKGRIYMLCNKKACKNGMTEDSLEHQCAAHNKKPHQGRLYEWKPTNMSGRSSSDIKQCELLCTSTKNSSTPSVSFTKKILDGTPCRLDDVQGVCIEGRCRAIGCNKKLGSRKKADLCGVCGGRNTSCKLQTGVIKETLDRGYNAILTLPAKTRSIDIEKESESTTSLALRVSKRRQVLRRALSAVDQHNTKLEIAGTQFYYHRPVNAEGDIKEKLFAKGPTNQIIYIMVLSPVPSASVVIKYTYTIPKRSRAWRRRHKQRLRKNKLGSSKENRKKFHTSSTSVPVSHYFDLDERRITPTEQGQSKSEDTLYGKNTSETDNTQQGNNNNANNAKKTAPFIKYSGKDDDEEVRYVPPEGSDGITNKDYTEYDRHTHSYNSNRLNLTTTTVAPRNGDIDEKDHLQNNTNYRWVTDMSACSQVCNPRAGVPFTLTRCYDSGDNEVDQKLCNVSRKPHVTSSDCKRKTPCEPRWVASRWSRCSADCGSGYQYRTVRCWRILSPGLDSSIHNDLCTHLEKPVTVKKCRNIDCDVEPKWTTLAWNKCSVDCGQGVQTRSVECNAGVNRCSLKDKPASTRPCVRKPCENRMQWVVSKWSRCSGTCGVHHRRVGCRSSNGTYVNDSNCDVTDKPLSSQLCDAGDCPISWVPQMWSKCSTSCGEGSTFRTIICGKITKSVFEQLSDSECEHILKPHAAASCRGRSCPGQYTGKWYTGEWSQCSYSCGVGSRSRLVNCYLDNRPSDQCNVQTKPASVEQCRLPPCSTAAARTASASTVRVCRDDPRVSSCALVVQHKLCQHYYYRRACCLSCKDHS